MSRSRSGGDPSSFITWDAPARTVALTPPPARAATEGAQPTLGAGEGALRRLALIGRGGVGEIWRAHDPELDREVALKVLQAERALEEENLARFLHEARITAGLQHPGVIPIYGLLRAEDGRPCFTMPEVRGRTLKQRIVESHDPGTPESARWGSRRLLDAFHKVCDTLSYAHRLGVVHRDIKPQNILLGDFGEVYVADWGLARRRQDARFGGGGELPRYAGSGVTMTGTVSGTPAYMSPEQARGEDDTVGPATDVYALGVMLYEILVGRTPYAGGVEAVLTAVLEGRRPEWPAGVPEELRALAERCMALEPADRPEDAGQVARELERWLAGDRARERALAVVAEGDADLGEARALRARADELQREAAELLRGVLAADPVEAKLPGWTREDEAAALRVQAELREQRALQHLHAALNLAPELPEAHDRLADWYREAQREAEARRDTSAALRAGLGLEAHDRGQHAAWRRGDGWLGLVTDPPGAEVLLYRYELAARRLVPVFERSLGTTPLRDVRLPMGSYRLTLRRPGCQDVLYPVHIGRMERWDGVAPGETAPTPIWLPPEGLLGPGERYVPAGWFQAGGDPASPAGLPAMRLWVDGFVIGTNPVTNGEYVDFLNALVEQGREAEAMACAPRERAGHQGDEGSPILRRDPDGRFVLGPDADGDVWEPDQPVSMVGFAAANAYAAWRAHREGRPWRLVSEFEREKAARGVDGRYFPWGDQFDATWTRIFDSRPNEQLPASVLDFPGDTSPYEARHLAGNLMSWCLEPWRDRPEFEGGRVRLVRADEREHTLTVIRGGGYWHTPAGARAAQRWRASVTSRSQGVGVRVAWSIGERR